MGGFFGVVSKEDCVNDVYFGTDYHSHMGTNAGGMAIWNGSSFNRSIHSLENSQFRTKFEADLPHFHGRMGIGCISDTEPQPLTVRSRLGQYAITTVGRINNLDAIVEDMFAHYHTHFLETNQGEIYPTELVSVIIDQENSFKNGLLKAQELIEGSCSVLVLTKKGIYASRDKMGRTPVLIGRKEGSYCVSFESCPFATLDYSFEYELGPGEIVFLTADGYETISPPREEMKICAFLWVYYGYPSSTYEGMNVEVMRYRNGMAMARKDDVQVDLVAGIPDSGIGHAIGYSNESKIPYGRPFIKYTPTWSRSFMPEDRDIRSLVARMKLMPIREVVAGKRLLFCDDSIVRGTQLRETANLLYNCDAEEVHIRSACPPLVFGCKYLNFGAPRSESELVARRAIIKLEGREPESFDEYCDPHHEKYGAMVNCIREILNFSTLKYQNMDDMLDSIGLDHTKICTYCWNGKG